MKQNLFTYTLILSFIILSILELKSSPILNFNIDDINRSLLTIESDSFEIKTDSVKELDSLITSNNEKWKIKTDSLNLLLSQFPSSDSIESSTLKNNFFNLQTKYNLLSNSLDSLCLMPDSTTCFIQFESIINMQKEALSEIDKMNKSLITTSLQTDSILSEIIAEEQIITQPLISPFGPDSLIDIQNQEIMEAVYTNDSIYLRSLVRGFDKESLKQSWNIYRQIQVEDDSVENDSVDVENQELLATNHSIDSEKAITNEPPIEKEKILTKKKNNKKTTKPKIGAEIKNTANDSLYSYTDEVVFAIQLYASRDSLSDVYLNKFYKGNWDIKIIDEDSWHKYQIGFTKTYGEAKAILAQLNMPKAFIVPYLNNKKLVLWEVIQKHRADRASVSGTINNVTDSLLFVVQIAASRDSITNNYLKKIYTGEKPIRQIKEDNWYKYQILLNNSFHTSKEFWNNCGIKGSFVVAYLNGEKIPMYDAIKRSNNNSKNK